MKSLVEWQNLYDTLVNIRDNLDVEVWDFLLLKSLVRLMCPGHASWATPGSIT